MRKCNLCQSCWNLRCFAKLLGFCQATHEAPQNGVWFFDGHRGLLEDRFGFFHALSHRGWYHQQIHHSNSTINMTCESTHSRANSYIYNIYMHICITYIYTYKYHHSNSHKLWFRDVLATADTKAPGRTGCSSSPGTFLRRVWLISNNSVDLTKQMTVFELQKFLPRLVPNSHEVLTEIHYEFGEPM